MSRTLYLECYSGISGDMTVAALLDLGADQSVLEKTLKSLPVKGFDTRISRVVKSGLDACDFAVNLDQEHENQDHNMEYLHGHDTHGHDTHTHHHEHRGLPEILEIIHACDMTERARGTASRIFEVLAEAEAEAHGVPVEEVHFHEVGAVDSIVDIVSVAVCLDNLDVTEVIVPVLYEGRGTVRCQHGILPIPVPAVANIVAAHRLPIKITGIEGELITPTGAAIVAAVRTSDRLPDRFMIERTGLGAGKRQYEGPGLLRGILLGQDLPEKESEEKDVICKLECNIDDCSGEALGLAMDYLFEAGARDVHYTPVYMKKNRPAYQLNVICSVADTQKMEQIIFANTTTIGIRRVEMQRSVLKRELKTLETSFGKLRYKICKVGEKSNVYPEYESIAGLSRQYKISYTEAYQLALTCYEKEAEL